MRTHAFFTYALIAFASSAYAAPLDVRIDDALEVGDSYQLPGLKAVAQVNAVERRQDEYANSTAMNKVILTDMCSAVSRIWFLLLRQGRSELR